MEKVIFLDVDGVLNTGNTIDREGLHAVCEERVKILKKIVFATKADLVLSSTWRLYKDASQVLRERLQRFGMDFVDRTDDLWKKPRSHEILEWLSRHQEVKQFAIIDDDEDAEVKGSFFLTTFETGLTHDVAERVIEHLNAA